jgi:hypothetical protein
MDDKAQEDQAAIDRARHEVAVLATLIKKQLLALFKQPFDESQLPPVHLPSCPAFAASTGPRVSCKCSREYHAQYAERDQALASHCHSYLKTDSRRRNQAASRLLRRIISQFHSDLEITETIAHHTTTANIKTVPAFDSRAETLFGAESIEVQAHAYTGTSRGATGSAFAIARWVSLTIPVAEYLREIWSCASVIRLGRDMVLYEPIGKGPVARKARLIRSVLLALGKHHEPPSDGIPKLQQVPLTTLAQDLCIPLTGARYTALGDLLGELQGLRIVWSPKKTRSRVFRLLCYRHLPDKR